MGVVLAVQIKAGNVAGVDGFDQHLKAVFGGLGGGPLQVADVGGVQRLALGAQGQQASHDVNAGAFQSDSVVQRLRKAVFKLGLAPTQASQAALTGVPVARWGIKQHLLQAVVA